MLRFFGYIFARDLAASFHAVRLLGDLPRVAGPLVVYSNHPSWWDAQVFVWLANHAFDDRDVSAPMETRMLKRYPFFGRIGAFAVEPGTYAGAAAFLATGEQVLASPSGMLLVNAEGRFRDVRERPILPLSGLAHLARRVPSATFVPLAIEYAFWDERRPNLLMRFGPPVGGGDLGAAGAAAATARLGGALDMTMTALAEAARSRDPGRFLVMLEGRTRINFIYDAWRRMWAHVAGRSFDSAHGDRS